MLDNARITAVVPVSNIEAAIEFYEGALGLRLDERRDDLPAHREAEFSAGSGSLLLYESAAGGQSRHTVAGFWVDGLDSVFASLRARGVTFEEYDLPDLKTVDGIASWGDIRAGWCEDPDGNILGIIESLGSR